MKYTNSLVNADSFYANFTNTTFKKIPIPHLNFMFSKKATKIDKIFTVNLTLTTQRQINGEDLVNLCGLLRKHEI